MSFDPHRPADIFIQVEGPTGNAPSAQAPRPAQELRVAKQATQAPAGSELQRIASARLRAIAHSKEHSAGEYGWPHSPAHYQDFAGPQTSQWDAEVLACLGRILETPILNRSQYVWDSDNYDVRTGMFNLNDCRAVSIAELKAALDARIIELGLSKPKVWEWYADVREPHGHEWWRQDLATRVQKFRAA